ncbi:MAG: 50S ribosomal protein L6 [Bacteroidota bacterium]|jgi:large subunit ribosomal protein L6
MSRIGKLPIQLPKGVEVSFTNGSVKVKGPLGELSRNLAEGIGLTTSEKNVVLTRSGEEKSQKALHGLSRALVANMVKGVSEGYSVEQELVGVGYRASNTGNLLELTLGFSHNVAFELPKEIKVETKTERGKNPVILMKSIDKELLGSVAAKIRSLRPPEPYKGKGIKFANEVLRRKAGKAAGK